MTTRFGDFIYTSRPLIEMLFKFGTEGLGKMKLLRFFIIFCDVMSGFFDNWVYLKRIEVLKAYSKWQAIWPEFLCAWFYLWNIILQIIEKLIILANESSKETNLEFIAELGSIGGTDNKFEKECFEKILK